MKSILISDLHLCPQRPDLLTAFHQFLNELSDDVNELFILGDLFETWLGDDDTSDFAQNIQTALKQVHHRNILTYFQAGNRDFLVGKRFAHSTGMTLLDDITTQTIQNQRVLLMHGDLLCTDDVQYQRFRKRIQSPVIKTLLTSLPLSLRQKMARKLRQQTRIASSKKADHIMDVNAQTVQECIAEQRTDILIHGHTHRPGVEQLTTSIGDATRYTLGDWDTSVWWIEIKSDSEISLESEAVRSINNRAH